MGKHDEKEFFDQAFASSARKSVWKYYKLIEICKDHYDKTILNGCEGKRVLEYGCGLGSRAFALASNGALVCGIDISSYAIKTAQKRAEELKLAKLEFREMDAEDLTFSADEFDLVCGTGILHHLDLERSLGELSRVIAPSGRAVFMEPLGHNPVINMFRRRTPQLRTQDEHPLKSRDLKLCRQFFHRVEVRFFALFSLLSIPLLKTPLFEVAMKSLQALDRLAFQVVPPVGLLAWYSVIILEGPRQEGA